eukprot:jgi/Bigna1/144841/aug1.92_g19549
MAATSTAKGSHGKKSDFNAETDGENRWEKRRDGVIDIIKRYNPDIIATQEAIAAQVGDLSDGLDEYDYEGCCRLGGEEDEYCAIFYKPQMFQVVEGDTIWLSQNPQKAGSIGWDAMYPRIATWAVFEPSSQQQQQQSSRLSGKKQTFGVISTHFDHVGIEARKESAKLIKGLIGDLQSKYPSTPFVLCGDFNSIKTENEVYETLTTGDGALMDAWPQAEILEDGGWKRSTMHKFEGLAFDGCMGDGTVELCKVEDVIVSGEEEEKPSDGLEHIDWYSPLIPKKSNFSLFEIYELRFLLSVNVDKLISHLLK